MRKKYLSALLFGALLFASAGTFTSCKDYDDDIDSLQSQITDVKSAVTELQKKIADMKYVSNVAADGKGLKVTWNDGSTTSIGNVINEAMPEIPSPGDVVTFDAETGEILVNGKASGYYTLTADEIWEEEEFKVPYVNEDGYLVLIDKDGNEVVSKINVAPVTAVKNTDGSYVLTILSNGEKQEIVLPSAASSITSVVLAKSVSDVKIATQIFKFNGNSNLGKAADWKGPKALPANGDVVISSPTTMDIRLNPVAVDATEVSFYLTDTKNKDLKPLVFKATPESNDNALTIGGVSGRAANTGNGLWTLSMDNVVVTKDAYGTASSGLMKEINDATSGVGTAKRAYSVNAGHACRSEYSVTASKATPLSFSKLNLKQGSTVEASANINGAWDSKKTYKTGTPVAVSATEASALYDMYLEADASDVKVYGLTFDQEKRTFTIGKNPDVSSIPAKFKLYVWTVSNAGVVNKSTITVQIATDMQAAAEYSLITHNINVENKNNYFGIDLSTMKTALGDNLDAWMQNVDLSNIQYSWSEKKDGGFTTLTASHPFSVYLVSELKEIGGEAKTTDRNNANFLQVNVDNSKATGFKLDKTYYIKAKFVTGGATPSTLNEIVVPVTFKAPKLADLFAVKSGYVVDDVINAYFYRVGATNSENVELSKYFDKMVDDAKVDFTDTKVEGTDKAGSALYDLKIASGTSADFDKVLVELKAGKDSNGKPQNGYAKAVELKATKDNFKNWKYSTKGDDTYTLKIRLMSPIEQGTIAPVSGSSIVINGNDLVAGAKITDQQIVGKDYNGNTYSVVSDNTSGTGTNPNASWYKNPQIKAVTAAQDASKYIKEIGYKKAYKDATGAVVTGWFTVKGDAISNTVEVKMPVTVEDAWGYKKTVDVPVTIKKN